MSSLRTLAGAVFVIGVILSMAIYGRWLTLGLEEQRALVTISTLGVLGGGTVLAAGWLYDRYRERFPARALGEAAVTAAAALGLRSLGRDASTLDTGFRFLRPAGQRTVLTENLESALRAAWRPRFDWIFAGRWRDVDVRIFDYVDPMDPDRAWTCVTVPVDRSCAPLMITRRDALVGGVEQRLDHRYRSGDEVFDRAFHVEAADLDSARALLTGSLRTHLLRSAPMIRCAIEIRQHGLLLCGPTVPITARDALLDNAIALKDSIVAGDADPA